MQINRILLYFAYTYIEQDCCRLLVDECIWLCVCHSFIYLFFAPNASQRYYIQSLSQANTTIKPHRLLNETIQEHDIFWLLSIGNQLAHIHTNIYRLHIFDAHPPQKFHSYKLMMWAGTNAAAAAVESINLYSCAFRRYKVWLCVVSLSQS